MSLPFRSSPRAAAYSHTPPRMASKLSKAGKPCAQSMFPLALLRTKSPAPDASDAARDRKSTRLNSSHITISYAVFCLKKKKKKEKKKKNKTNKNKTIK